MKKLSATMYNASNAVSTLSLILAAILLFTACNKESATPTATATYSNGSATSNSSTTSKEISDADLTQAVTNAVSGSTSGLATQSETTAQITSTATLPCGTTKDTTITGSNPSWFIFTYSYNLNFSRTCVCVNGTPSQYNNTISGTSSYSVLLMSANDTVSAEMSVSGVQSSSANYVLNGTYTLKGTQQSLIGNQHSFNSTLTLTNSNVNIAKSNNQIVSGTADVQFAGTSSTGTMVNHTAALTFLGNNQATLVIDNGTTTTIQW